MFTRFLALLVVVSVLALAPLHSAAAGGRYYQPGVGSTQGYYEGGNRRDQGYRYDNYRHGYRDRSRFSAQIYIAPRYAPRVYVAPRYPAYRDDYDDGYGGYDDYNGYGGYDNGSYGASVIRCESRDHRVAYCGFYGGQITLARQVSRASCSYGYSWGVDQRGLWVANGCRGEFYAH